MMTVSRELPIFAIEISNIKQVLKVLSKEERNDD